VSSSSGSSTLAALLLILPACKEDPSADAGETGSQTQTSGASESADSGDSSEDTGTDTGEEGCATETASQLRDCVDRDAYLEDLEFIAQPRDPGSAHWSEVQALCAERFEAYGFETELQSYATGVNVVGRLVGTETPEQEIVLAAHYDHIPECAGADDNATGTAGVLEAARILSQRSYPRTLVVACWDEEELGLIGSAAYANAAAQAGEQILFNYNFEMIGYYDESANAQTVPDGLDLLFPNEYEQLGEWNFSGDWIAMIVDSLGTEHTDGMAFHADAIGLKYLALEVPSEIKNNDLISDLRRSDHAAFWAVDYSATMITDTSNFRYSAYHCQTGDDLVENLNVDFAAQVVAATIGGAAESLGAPR
jgi:hypothetical protein